MWYLYIMFAFVIIVKMNWIRNHRYSLRASTRTTSYKWLRRPCEPVLYRRSLTSSDVRDPPRYSAFCIPMIFFGLPQIVFYRLCCVYLRILWMRRIEPRFAKLFYIFQSPKQLAKEAEEKEKAEKAAPAEKVGHGYMLWCIILNASQVGTNMLWCIILNAQVEASL